MKLAPAAAVPPVDLGEAVAWRLHVWAGAALVELAVAALLSYFLATPAGPHRSLLTSLTVLAGVTGFIVPVAASRISRPKVTRLVAAWAMGMIGLLGVGAYLDGAGASPIVVMLGLPTMYCAVRCDFQHVASSASVVVVAVAGLYSVTASRSPSVLVYSATVGLFCLLAVAAAHNRAQQERRVVDLTTRLTTLSQHDDLTGLPNRRAFYERLGVEVERTRRDGQPLAVIAIDLDNFKSVNDRDGHNGGDEALRRAAAAAHHALRTGDFLARVGGDEFMALLPGATNAEALKVAERIRRAVADLSIGDMTASVGVAVREPEEEGTRTCERADTTLYAAKHRGKNVSIAAPSAGQLH